MEMETYRGKLKDRGIEQGWIDDICTKGGSCSICGFDDNPLIIEKHHVGGKANSGFMVSVCPNCHQSLTMPQEPLKEERAKPSKPRIYVLAFVLEGIANLLLMVAHVLKLWVKRIFMGVVS